MGPTKTQNCSIFPLKLSIRTNRIQGKTMPISSITHKLLRIGDKERTWASVGLLGGGARNRWTSKRLQSCCCCRCCRRCHGWICWELSWGERKRNQVSGCFLSDEAGGCWCWCVETQAIHSNHSSQIISKSKTVKLKSIKPTQILNWAIHHPNLNPVVNPTGDSWFPSSATIFFLFLTRSRIKFRLSFPCLLYTSDAADE